MAYFRNKLTITKPILRLFKCCVFLGMLVVGSSFSGPAQAGEENLSAGFLYDEFNLTLEPGYRTEAAGPFYYSERKESEATVAFPPFFSAYKNTGVDSGELNVLYPVVSYEHYSAE